MNWLDLCLPVTKQFEGCAKKKGSLIYPYLDTLANPPRWTRGYGRTYGIDENSQPIDQDTADQELAAGLTAYARRICTLAPALISRPACLAAVADWSWNCGVGAFRASRLCRAINEGRWTDAAQFIRKPDTAGGIVRRGLQHRRAADAAIFAQGVVQ